MTQLALESEWAAAAAIATPGQTLHTKLESSNFVSEPTQSATFTGEAVWFVQDSTDLKVEWRVVGLHILTP